MASQLPLLCGPCSRDDEESHGSKWCTDCNEGLCLNCSKHHRKSLASSEHHMIDIDEVSDVFPILQELPKTCPDHDHQPLSFFCTAHDVICCPLCIPYSHSNCLKVISIQDASKNVHKSAALSHLREQISETNISINHLIEETEKNKNKIDRQTEDILKEISDLRKKLNDRLDFVEAKSRFELKSSSIAIKEDANTISRRLFKQLEENQTMEQCLFRVVEKGSEIQLFRTIKRLETKQNKIEKMHSEIEKDFSVKSLRSAPNNAVINSLEHLRSICDIRIEIEENELINRNSKSQVQYLNVGPPILTKKQVIQSESVERGIEFVRCCFLSNNRFLFTCYTDCIVICDHSFKIRGKVRLPTVGSKRLKYAHTVSESIVAITYGNALCLVDTNTYSVLRSVELGLMSVCDGVAKFKDDILVCVNKRLTVINQDLKNVRTISHAGTATVVECYQDKIFYTGFEGKMLWCILSDGNPIFQIELNAFLQPTSICIDKFSRIYIVSVVQNSVKCILADGKQQFDLLIGELTTPTSITIHDGIMMIVDGKRKKIRLYSIQEQPRDV